MIVKIEKEQPNNSTEIQNKSCHRANKNGNDAKRYSVKDSCFGANSMIGKINAVQQLLKNDKRGCLLEFFQLLLLQVPLFIDLCVRNRRAHSLSALGKRCHTYNMIRQFFYAKCRSKRLFNSVSMHKQSSEYLVK